MEQFTENVLQFFAFAGPALVLLGLLGFGAGLIYTLIVAVQTGCLGFISVFIPFLNIYWAVRNWDVAQGPITILAVSSVALQIGMGLRIMGINEVDAITMVHVGGYLMMQVGNLWLFYRALDHCSVTGEWWFPVIPLMPWVWAFKAWEQARAPVCLFLPGLVLCVYGYMNGAILFLRLYAPRVNSP